MVQHLVKEPSTCDVFARETFSILQESGFTPERVRHDDSDDRDSPVDEELLRRLCKELTMKCSKGNYSAVECIVTEIKKLATLRTAAKITKTPWATFLRMCSAPKKQVTKGHHLTKKDRATVEDFIHRDDVTMRLPTARQAKFHFMCTAMAPAYKQYCQEQEAMGSRVLSLSAFYHALPKHLKYMHDVPYRSCLCEECLNFSLLVDALDAFSGSAVIASSRSSNKGS